QNHSFLEIGIDEYQKGQYTFAINSLRKFIQTTDDNHAKAKAYYYLSLSYYFEGNQNFALSYLNELSTKYRLSEYSTQAFFWKGLIYQNQLQWDNAEVSFLKYASLLPKSKLASHALLAAANAEMKLGKANEAERNLTKLMDQYPQSEKLEEASVLYLYILKEKKAYEKAEDFLQKWISELGETGADHPYKDRFWLYGAEIALEKGDLFYAKALLKKIDNYAAQSPSSDIALLRLYEIEDRLQHPKEARAYLIRLMNEFPDSQYIGDSTFALGLLDFQANHFTDAVVHFKQVLEYLEKKASSDNMGKNGHRQQLKNQTQYYLAETYYQTNDFVRAKELFSQILIDGKYLVKKTVLRMLEILFEESNLEQLLALSKKYDQLLLTDQQLKSRFLLYLAKIYYLNQQFDESLNALSKIEDQTNFGYALAQIKAKNLVKKQQYTEAIEIFKNSLEHIPFQQKPFTAYQILSLYFQTGKYESMISYYNMINTYAQYLKPEEKNELKIKAGYLTGISLMEQKKYQQGISLFLELQNNEEENLSKDIQTMIYQSYYYLGWMYYKASQYEMANKAFLQAVQLVEDAKIKKEALYMNGWTYYTQNQYQQAGQIFQQLYKQYYPDDIAVKAYYQLGKTYTNMGQKDKALTIFREIALMWQQNSYSDEAYFEIIKESLLAKEITKSNQHIKEFAKLYGESPLYPNILLFQAETLLELNRYSEAFSVYQYLLNKFPSLSNKDTALYWSGYSAYQTRDYQSAEESLKKLIQQFAGSSFYASALQILQQIYQQEQKYKDEKGILLRLQETELKNEKYADRIQQIDYIEQGMAETEALYYGGYLSGDQKATFLLADYYYTQQKKAKAIVIFKDLAAKRKGIYPAKANNYLADLEYKQLHYQQALAGFSLTISQFQPDSETLAEALYKAAFCYYKLGDQPAAQKVINTLKTKISDSPWTTKAIELEQMFQ
ncbi:MAG: tetratricopeptide repeat protein, partial [Spirochaetes bacterium]|nr:tetratricopeptide repeat protein [Spirochaetota bacterium]